jgi:amidohydrolase
MQLFRYRLSKLRRVVLHLLSQLMYKYMQRKLLPAAILLTISLAGIAQKNTIKEKINAGADKIESKTIAWRRDFHEHPELGNREFRTAKIVADHLRALGLEVQEKVAHTGVVAILKGDKPGPVVALRADMDALPVTERVNIPFASKVKAEYDGQAVGVMHACGHDTHTAILMSVAEVLAGMKKELKGAVKFIFQPAEEGVPKGETGGAKQMVEEGVLDNPKVDAIFGLHINSLTEAGKIRYRPMGTMASAADFRILVKGKQSHGASPWAGVDPIVIAAQIVTALQTIVSRNVDITRNAAVVTVGKITSGVRFNIIPETAELIGTIRALSSEDEKMIYEKVRKMATDIAEAMGGEAEVALPNINYYPVTYNNPELTAQMLPSLEAAAGKENVGLMPAMTGAEDFSFYAQKVPGLFFFLGGMPKGKNPKDAAPHHTPDFYLDESGMKLGVKALCGLVFDYMEMKTAAKKQ